MIYIFLIAIAIVSIVVGIFARKQISECKNEEEKELVKSKWQLICGLLGLAVIILAGILIFTMF